MQYQGRGKSKEVYLIPKNHKLNPKKYPMGIAIFAQHNLANNMDERYLRIYLNEQMKRYKRLFSFGEKYLILPLEFGVFVPEIKECFVLSAKDRKREIVKITEVLDMIASEEFREIFLYELMPFVNGGTFNSIVENDQFDSERELSLVLVLRKLLNNYAHNDLTGSNIMYGNRSDKPASTSSDWYIIDNDQLGKHTMEKGIKRRSNSRSKKGRKMKVWERTKSPRRKEPRHTLLSMNYENHPDVNNLEILKTTRARSRTYIENRSNDDIIDLT
jgi:hypothetical protein